MVTWDAQGLTLEVSVNISALHLQSDSFSERLAMLLSMHPEVAPSRLTLEILETSALESLTHIARVIQDCQALGVHFSLDDFGTGYSSLTYLRHLPVEELKIDQTFACEMLTDSNDLAANWPKAMALAVY